jgi:beta-phosphoglucomutase-like phosphatase (HAD superfamily)
LIDLDAVAAQWQTALDAADLPNQHQQILQERQEVGALLRSVARMHGIPPPWLPTFPVSRALVGLNADVDHCLFELEGVLTDSGVVHARAWAEVFDDLLRSLSERTDREFTRFDVRNDYGTYVEGRPRLEGVHAFLASRGIQLSDERADELAGRKASILTRVVHERGVTALPGVRRYLEAAGYAGIDRVVLSASASTRWLLDLAGLGTLVESHVTECTPTDGTVAFMRSPHAIASAAAAGIEVRETPLAQLIDPRIRP